MRDAIQIPKEVSLNGTEQQNFKAALGRKRSAYTFFQVLNDVLFVLADKNNMKFKIFLNLYIFAECGIFSLRFMAIVDCPQRKKKLQTILKPIYIGLWNTF